MDGNHLFLNFHQLGSRTHLGLILGLSVKGKPSDSSKNTSLWCVTNVGGFSERRPLHKYTVNRLNVRLLIETPFFFCPSGKLCQHIFAWS